MAQNGFMSWLGKFNPQKLDPVEMNKDSQTLTQNSNLAVNNTPSITGGEFVRKNLKHDIQSKKENQGKNQNQQQLQALVKKFYSILDSRKNLLSTLESLRSNDVVQTIIDVVIDDGFYSSSTPEIFTVKFKGSSETELIQNIIDDLVSDFSLNDLIADILEDLLLLGEYMLSMSFKQGVGLVEINDDVNLQSVFGIYKSGQRTCYLKKNNNAVQKLDKNSYAHFVLSPRKLRVEMQDSNKVDFIPNYIRIGRPFILNAINKLKQLQTLEMGNLALDLKQILAPVLVMVGVPAITTPEEVSEIIERYEKHLSDIFDTGDMDGDFDLSDMMSISSKVKVLPNFADSKGSIETLQINSDKTSDREREEALRKAIASATGVLPNYLSILDSQGVSKMESMKTSSRYSKKLNSVQQSVSKGIKEIIYFHLEALGKKVNPDDIVIKMRSLINMDNLDNIEYLVTMSTAIGDFFDSLVRITESEELNLKINTDVFLKFLQGFFNQIPNAEGLIEYQEPSKTPKDGGEFV